MNKSAVLFALCSLAVGSVAMGQTPFDPNAGAPLPNNPGFNPERSLYGPFAQPYGPTLEGPDYTYNSDRFLRPLYYKPTMRYYGNGYTVNYRYVPVYRGEVYTSVNMGEASNFRTEAFRLTPEQVATWGAGSPRITVKDNSSSGPRTAVTSIVHKKTTTRTSTRKSKDTGAGDNVPAIQPGTAPAPTPTPESATPKQ